MNEADKNNLARAIFNEIEKHERKPSPKVEPIYVLTLGQLAELKRKYITPTCSECPIHQSCDAVHDGAACDMFDSEMRG